MERFIEEIVGAYWSSERVMVDEWYERIIFPFGDLDLTESKRCPRWAFAHFCRYLKSRPTVAERLERKQAGSLELIPEDLKNVWSEVSCEREIACPLAFKVTRIAEDDTISAILRGN